MPWKNFKKRYRKISGAQKIFLEKFWMWIKINLKEISKTWEKFKRNSWKILELGKILGKIFAALKKIQKNSEGWQISRKCSRKSRAHQTK